MLRLAALLSLDVRQTARDTSDRAQGAARFPIRELLRTGCPAGDGANLRQTHRRAVHAVRPVGRNAAERRGQQFAVSRRHFPGRRISGGGSIGGAQCCRRIDCVTQPAISDLGRWRSGGHRSRRQVAQIRVGETPALASRCGRVTSASRSPTRGHARCNARVEWRDQHREEATTARSRRCLARMIASTKRRRPDRAQQTRPNAHRAWCFDEALLRGARHLPGGTRSREVRLARDGARAMLAQMPQRMTLDFAAAFARLHC